jgi:hypothetical protein
MPRLVAGALAGCLSYAALAPAARAESFGVTEAHFEAGTCVVTSCTYKSVEENHAQAYTQAAGHPPYGITTFEFNTEPAGVLSRKPIGNARNVRVDIPPGLAANPQSLPRCAVSDFEHDTCAATTRVGTDELTVFELGLNVTIQAAVYNLEPAEGLPLEFGIHVAVPLLANEHILLIGHLSWFREPAMEARGVATGDYHEYFELNDIPDKTPVVKSKLIFEGAAQGSGFLTMPSACSSSETAHLRVESYEGQVSETFTHTPVGVEGCGSTAPPFKPSIEVKPSAVGEGGTSGSDEPDATTVTVDVPQNATAGQLDSADPRQISLTLPPGMTLNPAAARGLGACSDAQFGVGPGTVPVVEAVGAGGHPVECPESSRVGSFRIETPDLPAGSLTGSAYIGQPLSRDPASGVEYRIFLAAQAPRYGVAVRLVGDVVANSATGRLTGTVQAPQLPFSSAILELRGGPGAVLANPLACGAAQAEALLVPYGLQSGAEILPPPARPASTLTVTGCPDPIPFSLQQTTSVSPTSAGAQSSFTLSLARSDGQQYLTAMHTTLPAGLLGSIASVPLCEEAQANAGACPASSRIGSVHALAGAGPSPLEVPLAPAAPGSVYLTGPYGGAPFGLLIALPAENIGPFDFGTVTTRARIDIDPRSTRVSVTATVPTIVGGAPVRLRGLVVTIDRHGFLVNPTSCAQLATESTLTGTVALPPTPDATDQVGSAFRVSGCGAQTFKPAFRASTSAKTSRLNGASLQVSITRAAHQANLKEVAVTLPAQLVSRNSTLLKACTEAQARAGLLSCPAAARVGNATLVTPLLPAPLHGPGILVSHGGAAFPDLDFVLQGDGVTLVEESHTSVRHGVTSSTFSDLPDAQFTSFAATFPEGSDSLLSANGSLCTRRAPTVKRVAVRRHGHLVRIHGHRVYRTRKSFRNVPRTLLMPTRLVSQNGVTLAQSTPIAVSGCGGGSVRQRALPQRPPRAGS